MSWQAVAFLNAVIAAAYLVIFWVFAGAMLVLGALLAFTVIYVTMTVNLAERTG